QVDSRVRRPQPGACRCIVGWRAVRRAYLSGLGGISGVFLHFQGESKKFIFEKLDGVGINRCCFGPGLPFGYAVIGTVAYEIEDSLTSFELAPVGVNLIDDNYHLLVLARVNGYVR